MKKIYKSSVWFFIVVIFVVFNLGGCAALRKKFIPKKKKEKVSPTYSRIEEYNTVPTIEIYEKHYIFWRSWHREIMELLGENSKKDKRCISEMIGNLQDLRSMLVDEKGNELDKHIAKLKEVEQIIIKRNLTSSTKTRIRRILEKEYVLIKISFSYRKIEPFIRKEFRRIDDAE